MFGRVLNTPLMVLKLLNKVMVEKIKREEVRRREAKFVNLSKCNHNTFEKSISHTH